MLCNLVRTAVAGRERLQTAAWALDIGAVTDPTILVPAFLEQASRSAPLPGEVRLWSGSPNARASEMLAGCKGILTPLEQAHAWRLRDEDDVCAYVAGHAGLRLLLAAALNCEPAELQFGAGPNGKPFLDRIAGRSGFPTVHFNLSHTRGGVLVGLSGSPIGVDVESVNDLPNLMEIARVVFAPEIVERLAAACGAARTSLFYRFWTLSEAFIKATGLGISQGLDTFAFSPDGDPCLRRVTPGWGAASRWRFGLLGG